MRIEWDRHKDEANRATHGVSFDLARLVFDDPMHPSIQDRHVAGEERWQTIGLVGDLVLLVVAHTYREQQEPDEIIRIISARKATANERRRYEKDI